MPYSCAVRRIYTVFGLTRLLGLLMCTHGQKEFRGDEENEDEEGGAKWELSES